MMRRTQRTVFTALRNVLLATGLIGASGVTARTLFAQTSVTEIQPEATTPSNSVNGALAPQSPFLGSVPTGAPTGTVLTLSLSDALNRGLKYNLGMIESDVRTRTARAARLKDLNALLPDVNASISQSAEQVNLRALGFNFSFPGVSIPAVVGPFGVQDARASVSQTLFDWNSIQKVRSSNQQLKASQASYKSSRDLVVLAVANAYLQVIADQANADSQRAQVATSQALYQRAHDQNAAGVAARIDELRAQVELQTQQQRLIAVEDQRSKDMLSLARVIGLPAGQEFTVTDSVPYAPLEGVTLEKAFQDAYANRADFLSAQLEVGAAALAKRAAVAENYPTVTTNANYGDIGPNFGNSHGTFYASASVNIPIFQGTRVKADVLNADATLQQRQAELDDLKGRIDQDVRSALLDLNSASDLVKVARSNMDLARETLTEAQDRFTAGVSDNIEVVQAQESVAAADQAYISSLYAFNVAKVQLARAAGIAEQSVRAYLGGK
jgi:outer membrane protein TolC